MRTTVMIDDELMEKALKHGDAETKSGVIEEALQLLVQFKCQEKIRSLRGKLPWEGDLDAMRRD